MNTLDARWLLLKRMDQAQLQKLHAMEKALWKSYGGKNRSNAAPVWWQAAVNLMSRDGGLAEFFWEATRSQERNIRAIGMFSSSAQAEIKKRIPHADLENAYLDPDLLHACDHIVREHVSPPQLLALAQAPTSRRAKHALDAIGV